MTISRYNDILRYINEYEKNGSNKDTTIRVEANMFLTRLILMQLSTINLLKEYQESEFPSNKYPEVAEKK